MDVDDSPPNALLWVGTLVGVAFGALIVFLFRERSGAAQPINIYNLSGGEAVMKAGPLLGLNAAPAAAPQKLVPMSTPNGTSYATRANTITLDSQGSKRVWGAPLEGPMWRVRLSVVGPAGGFGMFSLDQPLPDGPMSNLTMGSPQGIIVPAGQWTEIRIEPQQVIYGRAGGTEDDVQVSILASAEFFS